MIVTFVIAIAAGCASALMFASIISGALISLPLLYLAPLPLMVAALGWGPLAATIGGIAAALSVGALFGVAHCVDFALTVALPAWWLGHLVLLGRATDTASNGAAPASPVLEWYPIGRILLWIAVLSVMTTMAALLMLGSDAEAINSALRELFQQLVHNIPVQDGDATANFDRFIDRLTKITPAIVAFAAMTRLILNLWLAAKITQTSGRLQRPWPDLRSIALPPMTLVAFCVAVAFCFVGGLLGMVARVVTAALLIDYALIGFAVLHTVTLSLNGRAFWLACAYSAVLLFGGLLLPVALLGLADAVFGFRQRYLRGRPPPLPAS